MKEYSEPLTVSKSKISNFRAKVKVDRRDFERLLLIQPNLLGDEGSKTFEEQHRPILKIGWKESLGAGHNFQETIWKENMSCNNFFVIYCYSCYQKQQIYAA
jgi:hypothetical protein